MEFSQGMSLEQIIAPLKEDLGAIQKAIDENLKDKMKLPLGIYAGVVYIHHLKKIRKAAIVIGPLDKKKVPKIEAHIVEFSGKLYGKKLTLYLYKFLRLFQTFKTKQLLIAQIKKDIKRVKKEVATPAFA